MARITLEFPDALMDTLKAMAERDHRSVSSLIRLSLLRHLETMGIKTHRGVPITPTKPASQQPPAQSKPSTAQATSPSSPKPKAVDDEVDLDGIDFDD